MDNLCGSRYKSAMGVVCCTEVGSHIAHRGGGYNWKREDEYVTPQVNPVTEAKKLSKPQTATEKQVGGTHYGMDLQPIDVIDAWKLDFYEGSALKYLARHRKKNGREDIEKAIHYLELLLERQYGGDESV